MAQNTHTDNSKSQNQTVAYKARLNSWAVARVLPDDLRPEIVTRFRSRSDAEGHLHLMRRLTPSDRFEVIFDCQREESVN